MSDEATWYDFDWLDDGALPSILEAHYGVTVEREEAANAVLGTSRLPKLKPNSLASSYARTLQDSISKCTLSRPQGRSNGCKPAGIVGYRCSRKRAASESNSVKAVLSRSIDPHAVQDPPTYSIAAAANPQAPQSFSASLAAYSCRAGRASASARTTAAVVSGGESSDPREDLTASSTACLTSSSSCMTANQAPMTLARDLSPNSATTSWGVVVRPVFTSAGRSLAPLPLALSRIIFR